MIAQTQPRQPKGRPVGGQFAVKSHHESDLMLDANDYDEPVSKRPTKRTDVHRPVELNPEDYEWVGAYDNEPEPGSFVGPGGEFEVAPGVVVPGTNRANAEYRYLRGLIESSPSARYGDGFRCDHCGAHIRYVAVYKHKPTGDHIAVGETCADGRLSLDRATFQRLRKAAALDRKQQVRKKAARARLEEIEDPLIVSLLDRDADLDAMDDATRSVYQHSIVSDIRHRLWQYGLVSDKQVELVRKIYDRSTAEPEPEPPKIPVPVGSQQIEGTVLAMRFQESQWGGTVKMLVEVETPAGNYKVWGTVPSALGDLDRGAKIRFKATCEQSSDDTSFGFFSRPTKAELLEAPSERSLDELADI